MNNEFDREYNDFDELYDSMMETNPEDWLPDTGIREEFDAETIAMLNNFWSTNTTDKESLSETPCQATGEGLLLFYWNEVNATPS